VLGTVGGEEVIGPLSLALADRDEQVQGLAEDTVIIFYAGHGSVEADPLDQDADGIITVSEVFGYLTRKVPEASGLDQHPVRKGETQGELVLGRIR